MNSALHTVTDAVTRPIRMFLTAGQTNNDIGARARLAQRPQAKHMLVDCGYNADWHREALVDKGITPCIPGRNSQDKPVKYNKRRYKRRSRI